MSTSQKIRWGIFSTGGIAKTFAKGLRDSQSGELVAVASRSQESANTFAAEFSVPRAYASYEALLEDDGIDAVYIATPHPLHAALAIKSAEAGKHILCEKPLTLTWAEAARVVESARRHGVQLLEAFMYRCHPQSAKIVELVQSGALGEVRHIEATFAFTTGADESSRWLNLELGGGGILDVGCYTISMARLVAGAAQGKAFAEPVEVKALGKLGETGCDDYTSALLRFPGDILAVCTCGVRLNGSNMVRITGTQATLTVPSPWFCSASPNLILDMHGGEKQEITVESPHHLYTYEADALAALIRGEKPAVPAQTGEDALGNMRTLDWWRREIGLVYPAEKAESQTVPVTGEPLRVFPNDMRYGSIAQVTRPDGSAKPISKIVLGTMIEGALNQLTQGLALFDDFFERGGTCFDTAYVYGTERIVGHWIKTRGVRDDVTLIVKGAHTPYCTPEGLTRQLNESLERLQIEGTDIYMLHRDNLDVPVGEFVEVLNEHMRAGKMKAFGGSNWSLERLQEANEYAHAKGLQGLNVVSNNFSLARMVEPVWQGGISSSDAASRAWFEANEISLFSWSSQARGFFARAARDFTTDSELVRCWYSDDNFERLERVREMASQKGVSPVVVAAAYVLAQPFPIYALIGPRTLAETRDSMEALTLELSPDEARWLNLEA